MDTPNTSRPFPGEYRLDVEDFGPIAKASVDLRPLTVFIGPSNTGKSYLAILVYALHQCFGAGNIVPYGRVPRYHSGVQRSLFDSFFEANDDDSVVIDEFRKWLLNQIESKSQYKLPFDNLANAESDPEGKGDGLEWRASFPKSVDTYIRSVFAQSSSFGRYPESEIGRCFGVEEMSHLVRVSSTRSVANVTLSIPRTGEAGIAQVNFDIHIHESDFEYSGNVGGDESLYNEIETMEIIDDIKPYIHRQMLRGEDYDNEDVSYMLARVSEAVVGALLEPLYRSAYYLPADRTGVMHSHQVVVSTLVQSATTAGLKPSANIPILSGVLADFLSQLIEVPGDRGRFGVRVRRREGRRGNTLAMRLEQDVLKGAIHMENAETGYPSFYYWPDGWKQPLPLMRASSMVSELAPVVLYLRHLVRPGDVLIIEEPESHLHPAIQVEFTRQLARLVRAGIRVIVTTHSEWLLQELANIVRASELPEADRAGIAGGDVALKPDEVGAWLFELDAGGDGSKVREIGLDESGLYPADFDDVAAAMHNDWAEIFSRLGEHE